MIIASRSCLAVEVGVVRHKFFLGQILIQDWMARVLQAKAKRGIELGPAVVEEPGRFRQGADGIESRDRVGRLLDRRQFA